MAAGDAYITCLNNEAGAEALLRLVAVDSDGNLYIDCDNTETSIADIINLLIVEDASGNPAVSVALTGAGTSVIKQDLESVTNGVAYPVAFATAFADNGYSLSILIHDAGGNLGTFVLNTRTAAGFTITPTVSGTMNWIAIRT